MNEDKLTLIQAIIDSCLDKTLNLNRVRERNSIKAIFNDLIDIEEYLQQATHEIKALIIQRDEKNGSK